MCINAALTQLPSAALTLLLLHSAHCRQWKDLQLLKTWESNCCLSTKFWNAPVATVAELCPWLTKASLSYSYSGRAIVVEGAACPWGRCYGTLSWCHGRNSDTSTGSYSRIVSLQDPSDCLLYPLGISISFPWKQLTMVIIQRCLTEHESQVRKTNWLFLPSHA